MRIFLFVIAMMGVSCQYNRRHQPVVVTPSIDPYKILDLPKDATQKQIKTAYRKFSLKYHPDKNKSPDAKEKMTQVSDAYEMVGDPDKKLIFDEFGSGEKFTSRWQYEQNQRRKGKGVSQKGFYQGSEDVTTFTIKNFYKTDKTKGKLVEFYAPWCVHCQDMVGEYKKVAILFDGEVSIGAANCEAEENLCSQQGIRSYPTIRLFFPHSGRSGQGEIEDYQGEHTADALYSFVKQSLSIDLIQLTGQDFDQARSGELWLIDFSAGSWCGPCTMLKSPMRRLASSVQGKAQVGMVDCDRHKELCASLGVSYYPQLRLFYQDGPENGETMEVNNQFPAAGMLDLFERLLNIFDKVKGSAAVDSETSHDEL